MSENFNSRALGTLAKVLDNFSEALLNAADAASGAVDKLGEAVETLDEWIAWPPEDDAGPVFHDEPVTQEEQSTHDRLLELWARYNERLVQYSYERVVYPGDFVVEVMERHIENWLAEHPGIDVTN